MLTHRLLGCLLLAALSAPLSVRADQEVHAACQREVGDPDAPRVAQANCSDMHPVSTPEPTPTPVAAWTAGRRCSALVAGADRDRLRRAL